MQVSNAGRSQVDRPTGRRQRAAARFGRLAASACRSRKMSNFTCERGFALQFCSAARCDCLTTQGDARLAFPSRTPFGNKHFQTCHHASAPTLLGARPLSQQEGVQEAGRASLVAAVLFRECGLQVPLLCSRLHGRLRGSRVRSQSGGARQRRAAELAKLTKLPALLWHAHPHASPPSTLPSTTRMVSSANSMRTESSVAKARPREKSTRPPYWGWRQRSASWRGEERRGGLLLSGEHCSEHGSETRSPASRRPLPPPWRRLTKHARGHQRVAFSRLGQRPGVVSQLELRRHPAWPRSGGWEAGRLTAQAPAGRGPRGPGWQCRARSQQPSAATRRRACMAEQGRRLT